MNRLGLPEQMMLLLYGSLLWLIQGGLKQWTNFYDIPGHTDRGRLHETTNVGLYCIYLYMLGVRLGLG